MALTVYAYVVARPESVEQVEEAARSVVADCLREDGLVTYRLLRDSGNQRVFAWFEQWRDEAAFSAHLASPHVARLSEALEGHLEGDMVIQRYEDLT